ncbi:DUF3732 domain-containing protein [Halioxenophilus aromaticivorans]|uniref:DUF3732 domain-containing protein n=2 Tax=Halioxenophilus aromaticivorans TaxID=1306992 RepID=A0AAV3UA19_9ALTE
MTMQILAISLYGKNGQRRDVKFTPGTVNIITGASQRGKTSLIHIVEYCLGASECMVAAGHIRQTVDWYAIALQFPDCQVFIARAAPMPGVKANSACYMLVEKEISLPSKSELTRSTNIDSVVSFLTQKVGVPEHVTEVPKGHTRHPVTIGFRHSRYYLFQSQTEIANNEILFHQQARDRVPQNIKDTLPYFIGAAEDDRLSEMERLRSLKQERLRLVKQIKEIESLKGDGLLKGYSLLSEAADLGLYSSENLIPKDEVLLDQLELISRWSPSLDVDVYDEQDPLITLEAENRRLQNQKRALKLRLREAQEYTASESGFEQAVNDQIYRLQSVGLFKKFETVSEVCPVCESPHERASRIQEIIKSSLADLSGKLQGVGRTRPRISGYVNQLLQEQSELNNQLKRIKQTIGNIRSQESEDEQRDGLNTLRAKLAGKCSLYLESVDWADDNENLEAQLALLEEEISILSEKLDPEALREKLEAQLNCISEDMTVWAQELGLGYSNHRIRLDASKLTVVADTPDGRVTLDKMGSGENWMGYHVVTYLALAKWFIERARPVGRFIFFDQPSQVYFPADKSDSGDLSEIEKDEDRIAVKKLFEWIFKIVNELSPELQVIITDHADIDEPWYQQAIRDKKWRGEYALIPRSWYEEPQVTESDLYSYIQELVVRCKEELNYTPTYFIQMLNELGAIRAVSQLVLDTEVSEGFTKLALEGRLDLSVESVVLESPWSSLFDEDVIRAAKIKLRTS